MNATNRLYADAVGKGPVNTGPGKGGNDQEARSISGRSGVLEPAARGRWENGRCVLLSDDTFAGRPIKLRQIYTRLPERNPHWEQAMSVDGGGTWETNWHMDYTRA